MSARPLSQRTPSNDEALGALSCAACVLSPDGKVLEMNALAGELFGAGPDGCLGKSILDYIEGDADARARDSLLNACRDRTVFVAEVLWRRVTGPAFWNDLVLVPHGQADAMLLISRDVTARRTAESSLGRLPSSDRAVLDRVQAGFIVHGASTEILYANAKALEILGVSNESALLATNDDPRWAFVRADGTPMPIEEFPVAVALQTKQVAHDIIVGRRRPTDGKSVWAVCNAYPVRDAGGNIVEVIVSFTEVTALKQAERQLAVSQERLELVMAGSGDAPWDWEVGSPTGYYSSRWFAQIGYPEQDREMDASHWLDVLSPDERSRVQAEFTRHLDGSESSYEMEFSIPHRTGRLVRILARGFIMRDGTGMALRVSGVNTDVTERRAMEARLRQVQKLEAIGQLAGGVAHEFNNVLAVVIGNLDLLRTDLPKDSELLELLGDSIVAAQRGAELTRRLLAFSRQQVLATSVVDLERVVWAIERLIARLIGETVQVKVVVPHAVPSVRVDLGQLENALLNISINARDAMPDGGTLTIILDEVAVSGATSSYEDLPAGQYVRLALTDTGLGMSSEMSVRALEPFLTTKEPGAGTGLGLSMAYGFARQSGGTLLVRSTLGEGTTVEILLPGTTEQPLAPTDAHDRTNELQAAPLRGETVLIVEDDESVRRFCARSLQSLGFQTLAVADGPSALAAIAKMAQVDLLLTDVVMPGGMTGLSLAAQARQRHPHLRILYMSGSPAEAFAGDDPAARHRMLAKPFTVEVLARAVEDVLAQTP